MNVGESDGYILILVKWSLDLWKAPEHMDHIDCAETPIEILEGNITSVYTVLWWTKNKTCDKVECPEE